MAKSDRILYGTSIALSAVLLAVLIHVWTHPAIRYERIHTANILMVKGYATREELTAAVDQATEICEEPPGFNRDARKRAFEAANPAMVVTCTDSGVQFSGYQL